MACWHGLGREGARIAPQSQPCGTPAALPRGTPASLTGESAGARLRDIWMKRIDRSPYMQGNCGQATKVRQYQALRRVCTRLERVAQGEGWVKTGVTRFGGFGFRRRRLLIVLTVSGAKWIRPRHLSVGSAAADRVRMHATPRQTTPMGPMAPPRASHNVIGGRAAYAPWASSTRQIRERAQRAAGRGRCRWLRRQSFAQSGAGLEMMGRGPWALASSPPLISAQRAIGPPALQRILGGARSCPVWQRWEGATGPTTRACQRTEGFLPSHGSSLFEAPSPAVLWTAFLDLLFSPDIPLVTLGGRCLTLPAHHVGQSVLVGQQLRCARGEE